ncbi:hypothetical protein [Janthinobacterium agaricidamnosum]|uniref:Ribbon-helix-helix, copG family protein n=1 Tax=Janthinobacterium agaricidamnosum NBRC 102515 = DSM 9628 TaxID=1349767 RepID=W0V795_9BURK|nr:hypothetical protein [Janthinobacterium agaricidamnosum]CDG83440.1 hypothetical protein GJA_2809 [Janthinobacterium agaricidamnosum NBRC 102515 = DSM 9628]
MAAPTKVRLNADLSPDVASALKDLARTQNISLAQALSRAISTESALAKRRAQGAKVVIDDGNGRLSELVFDR